MQMIYDRINNAYCTEKSEEIFDKEEFITWHYGYVQAMNEMGKITLDNAEEIREYLSHLS